MRILSGIQPSGTIHIGNYFGMMRPLINMQDEGELFCFIASYHALTSVKDKEFLSKNILEAAINFLSLGLDPNKATFWVQSDVPEVTELYWILSNVTPLGLLNQAHSYKDKVTKGISPNHGLYSYPVLMAADILLYDAKIIPVGKDQIQHLEITRDIAQNFNNTFGETFILPEAKIDSSVAVVPGIDGAKMSKSYKNTIDLFASKKQLKKQVMKIVTDSTPLEEPKNWQKCNIYKLSELFMSEDELNELKKMYETPGYGYGHFKLKLLDKINEYFAPYEEKRNYYLNNIDEVKEILNEGAKKAKKIAKEKLSKVKEKIGLIY